MSEIDAVEVKTEMAVNAAFSAFDELMAIAADPEAKRFILRERIAMHQLVSRAQLLASFVDAALDQPGKVRMVVNNG